jgi:hypothetical protein
MVHGMLYVGLLDDKMCREKSVNDIIYNANDGFFIGHFKAMMMMMTTLMMLMMFCFFVRLLWNLVLSSPFLFVTLRCSLSRGSRVYFYEGDNNKKKTEKFSIFFLCVPCRAEKKIEENKHIFFRKCTLFFFSLSSSILVSLCSR